MKVLVAGSSGLVGSAVARKYSGEGHQVIPLNSSLVNLLEYQTTFSYLEEHKPDLIIDAAAKVGGIKANSIYPFDFLSKNLLIQNNLMTAALKLRVKKFVFLGSSCIYPKHSQQPIKEEYILTGPLEPTNSAYAIAKIAGIEFVKSIRNQFGLNWISVMPTNVYGPGDYFNSEYGHVVPAMISKISDARDLNLDSVSFWGDGTPLREFIFADDLAAAIFMAAQKYENELHLNIGSGEEISIRELATMVAKYCNYQGSIFWDSKQPNGTPRKILDSSRIRKLGWYPKVKFEHGLQLTIDWYQEAKKGNNLRK